MKEIEIKNRRRIPRKSSTITVNLSFKLYEEETNTLFIVEDKYKISLN